MELPIKSGLGRMPYIDKIYEKADAEMSDQILPKNSEYKI